MHYLALLFVLPISIIIQKMAMVQQLMSKPNFRHSEVYLLKIKLCGGHQITKSHICLAGLFSYRESEESSFFIVVRWYDLYQHLPELTRGRGSKNSLIIDLVLTSEPLQVTNIEHGTPLDKTQKQLFADGLQNRCS